MPAIDDDDRPKKKIVHEIGQDLTLLSVGELTERVALLKEEIARLEANMASKHASKSAADLSSRSSWRGRANPGIRRARRRNVYRALTITTSHRPS